MGQWKPGYGGANAAGCTKEYTPEEILSAVSAPTEPVITSFHQTSDNLRFNFQESTTTDDLFRVLGYVASCETDPLNISEDVGEEILDSVDALEKTLRIDGFQNHFVSSSPSVNVDITHSEPSQFTVSLVFRPLALLSSYGTALFKKRKILSDRFRQTSVQLNSLNTLIGEPINGDWKLLFRCKTLKLAL